MAVSVDKLWIKQFMGKDEYKVFIKPSQDRKNLQPINAYLTAPVVVDTKSDWSTFVESPFKEWSGISQVISGRSTQVWLATEQAWMGTEPLQFQLAFTFIALEDAKKEVIDPSNNVLKWPVPPDRDDPIKPPVAINKKKACSLYIGNYIHINESLLPVSAQVTFSPVLDRTGLNPIRADVTMSFVTIHAMAATDIDGWFSGGGARI